MPRPLRSGLLTMVPVDGFLFNSSSFTGNPVSPKLLVSLTNTRIPHRLGSLVANSSRLQSRSFQRDVSSDVGSHQWSRGLLVNFLSPILVPTLSRDFTGNVVSFLLESTPFHRKPGVPLLFSSAEISQRHDHDRNQRRDSSQATMITSGSSTSRFSM